MKSIHGGYVRFTRLVLPLLMLIGLSASGAQTPDTLHRIGAWKFPSADTAHDKARAAERDTAARPAEPQQPVDRKSPTTAAWLSFAWPGVGSYYAGANGHGTIHLTISVVSVYGFLVAGASQKTVCVAGRYTTCGTKSDQATLAVAALGVFATNAVWSIFTAASDARSHNDDDASGVHVATGLRFEPATRRLGAQLVTLRF